MNRSELPTLLRTGRALPLWSYRDPALHRRELERVFRGDWVFVGTEAELPSPGSFRPLEVGGQPVLLLRDSEGELRALSNLCAHRGTLLVEEAGVGQRFRCPYHAWTYAQDGSLLSAPFAPEIERARHGLARYRAEAWHGLVFVSLEPAVESIAERLAPVERHLAGLYDLATLRPWSDHDTEETWEANWKLIYANAAESYHLFQVHAETLEPYTPTQSAAYVFGNPRVTVTQGQMREGKGGRALGEYRLVAIPPNLVFVVDGQALHWQAVEPLSPSRSRVRTGGCWPGEPPQGWARLAASFGGGAGSLPEFLPEDRAICERGQRAAGGTFAPGRLAEVERVLVDFHHYLADHLYPDPGETSAR